MTADDLKKLDDQIAAKRAEREKFNQTSVQAKTSAKKLSAEIRELEARMPGPKERRGIHMQAEASKVALKPRR